MAHARVKLEKVYQRGEDPVVKEFADMISELYDLQDGYEMRDLSAEEIVRRIRKRLDEELRKGNEFRSSYMMQKPTTRITSETEFSSTGKMDHIRWTITGRAVCETGRNEKKMFTPLWLR